MLLIQHPLPHNQSVGITHCPYRKIKLSCKFYLRMDGLTTSPTTLDYLVNKMVAQLLIRRKAVIRRQTTRDSEPTLAFTKLLPHEATKAARGRHPFKSLRNTRREQPEQQTQHQNQEAQCKCPFKREFLVIAEPAWVNSCHPRLTALYSATKPSKRPCAIAGQ